MPGVVVKTKVLPVTSKDPEFGHVLYIPSCFSEEIVIDGNRARQLLAPEERASLFTSLGATKVTTGQHRFLVLRRKAPVEEGERVLIVPPELDLDMLSDLRKVRGVRWSGH